MNLTMYSLFTEAVMEAGFSGASKKALSLGFSSAEFLINAIEPPAKPLFSSVEDAKEAGRIFKQQGLSLACYSVFANLYKSPRTVEELQRHVEYAAAIGSPYLHHTSLPWFESPHNLPDYDEAIEIAIDAAEEVAKHAAKFGVTCIYEDQGFFINGIEGYRTFYSEMKRRCSNVAVCGDAGNSLFADLPGAEFFEEFSDDIVHVHIKDYFRKESPTCPGDGWFETRSGAWLHDAPIGEGIADIDACMAILKKSGYRGAVAIETEYIEDAVRYMKKYDF